MICAVRKVICAVQGIGTYQLRYPNEVVEKVFCAPVTTRYSTTILKI
jgi:hypothetical protein